MPRFFLRLTLIPIALFTAILLIIHAQPYDDHELRQLLLPAGCPPSCFIGIRSGVTSMDEALNILQSTGWVERFDDQQGGRVVKIKWNDRVPAWLAYDGDYGAAISFAQDVVKEFNLQTNLTLGEIQLVMGYSSFQKISLTDRRGHKVLFYTVYYPDVGVKITTSRNCDFQQGSIGYHDKGYLNYSQFNVNVIAPPSYHATWSDVLRTSCS